MPRSRRVDPAHRQQYRPDRHERPWQHPLGWSREQVALTTFNAHVTNRERAIDELRSTGTPVHLPPEWAIGGRVVAATNAHVGTRYLRLPLLRLTPMPLADALAARRPLGPGLDPAGTAPVGTFVALHDRWVAHDHAMRRRSLAALEVHAVPDGRVPVGAPLAVVVATSGSSRTRVESTHVARIESFVGDAHATTDAAHAAARDLLLHGTELVPLALVRDGAGARVARVGSSSLPFEDGGEPLVGARAGTGTTLTWRASSSAVVAVLGLDGTRWLA